MNATLKLVVLGDIHDHWAMVQAILDHEFPEGNGLALSVGDLHSAPCISGSHRLVFISGNHEAWEAIETDPRTGCVPGTPHLRLRAGELVTLLGLRVAGLPGVWSPRSFDAPANAKPRHFTVRDVEASCALPGPIHLFLSHEAPSGIGLEKAGVPLGSEHVRRVLEAQRPRLALCGHHHVRHAGRVGSTDVQVLDYPHRAYGVVTWRADDGVLAFREQVARLQSGPGGAPEYAYDWPTSILRDGDEDS